MPSPPPQCRSETLAAAWSQRKGRSLGCEAGKNTCVNAHTHTRTHICPCFELRSLSLHLQGKRCSCWGLHHCWRWLQTPQNWVQGTEVICRAGAGEPPGLVGALLGIWGREGAGAGPPCCAARGGTQHPGARPRCSQSELWGSAPTPGCVPTSRAGEPLCSVT